ncbi:MAG TPA: alpha/beta hydrolase [Burkholderiales bacterium]|nr:alpha/beta hydrolase [Burkholderiales bacterium]
MAVHPQVALLLEAVKQSPLPTLDKVPAFVARRLYKERCEKVAPKPPEAHTRLLLTPSGVLIRAYRPAGTAKTDVLPALVYFHGGGWTIGDLDTHDVLCRQFASGARCEVFSVEYRLAPESPFPAAVEDCIAATEFVAKVSKSDRIAVGGDSAGGNLAAVVALHARGASGPALCFQLLIYPATDQNMRTESLKRNGDGYLLTLPLMERFRANYLPRPADYADWRASPALAKSYAGLPPALVITAGFDPLLDEGRQYAELLARAGVDVVYRDYPDMVHGFIVMGGVIDTANAAVADCCAALRRAFEKVTA